MNDERMLGDLLVAAARLTRTAAYLAGRSESSATWRTLSVLAGNGSQRVGELAQLTRVTQPTMTKLVAGLEERGHVTRIPDPDDARASRVAVTAHGAAALADYRREMSAALAPYFGDLDDEDVAALRRTIRLLDERAARGVAAGAGRASSPQDRTLEGEHPHGV